MQKETVVATSADPCVFLYLTLVSRT